MQAILGGSQADMDSRKEGLPGKPCFSAHHVGRWLIPFFLTCAIYFLFWSPENQPSWVGALIKCLPILHLAVFLRTVHPGGSYSLLLQGALLCSAVGDCCLVWPEAFLYGMAAFAMAHLLYIWAFGLTPLKPGLLLPVLLVSIPYHGFLLWHLPPDMVLPLTAYSLVLAAMLWRGLARGGSAGWGALLFTLSDAVLAWNTFAYPLPHAHLVIMTTYYAAQVLIGLSAFQSPRLKSN
ncbi:lysoplasmalogenase [Hippopotamus amphibius kiboko]|uniref:lysoplasmalogenase n=1 Tax=Hippopotamus amphibius kiboko TaxID=575201 RepID=UPI002591C2C5|nr:lysoplasmalogenase [Hippopotamus amphibius kiboko]